MEKNQAGRGGKGIEFLVVDDEKMIIKELWAGEPQGLLSEIGYIFGEVGIIKQGEFLADNGKEFFPDLPFLANAEGLGRGRGKPAHGQIAEQEKRADNGCGEAPEGRVVIHGKYSDTLLWGSSLIPSPRIIINIMMISRLRHHLFRSAAPGRSTIAIS